MCGVYTQAHWQNSVHQWSRRLGFNPRLSQPKIQKIVLYTSLLNTQHYKVWLKCKWSNPEKGVVPSSTPWFCSYWKKSFVPPSTTVSQLIYSHMYPQCVMGKLSSKLHKKKNNTDISLYQNYMKIPWNTIDKIYLKESPWATTTASRHLLWDIYIYILCILAANFPVRPILLKLTDRVWSWDFY